MENLYDNLPEAELENVCDNLPETESENLYDNLPKVETENLYDNLLRHRNQFVPALNLLGGEMLVKSGVK